MKVDNVIAFALAMGAILSAIGLGCELSGCKPAQSPTNELRTGLALAADAVEAADQTCAEYGLADKNESLLTKCRDAYNVARPALLGAEVALDAGDADGALAQFCAAEKALADETQAIEAAGATLPTAVPMTLAFASRVCSVLAADGGAHG